MVVEPTDGPLEVRVDGEGEGEVPLDGGNLVVQSLRAGLGVLGVDELVGTLRVRCRNRIPHARGLGSSAAAVVAGLAASRALVPEGESRLDDERLLQVAAGIEGHPDNVAACLYGGLTLAWTESGHARALRRDPSTALVATVFVPPTRASTELARSLLPDEVPHVDAAANAGRAALLLEALTHRPDIVLAATEDRLHQRYRGQAMPESLRLVDELREQSVAAVLSGAGPSVLALTTQHEEDLAAWAPVGWQVLRLPVDHDGVRTWPGSATRATRPSGRGR